MLFCSVICGSRLIECFCPAESEIMSDLGVCLVVVELSFESLVLLRQLLHGLLERSSAPVEYYLVLCKFLLKKPMTYERLMSHHICKTVYVKVGLVQPLSVDVKYGNIHNARFTLNFL